MRRKSTNDLVRWDPYIPKDVANEVELMLYDPFLKRMRHGAKSELITMLLKKWLSEMKAPKQEAPEQTGLDN